MSASCAVLFFVLGARADASLIPIMKLLTMTSRAEQWRASSEALL
jgi:hypothetical protein